MAVVRSIDLVLRSRHVISGMNMSLIAKNIFDADVREPSLSQNPAAPEIPDDYPLDGRSINISFQYHFDN